MAKGLDTKVLDAYRAGLGKKAARVVGNTARTVEAGAKQLAPYDTGALKNSIRARSASDDDLTWTVSDGVEYGIFQELGTARIRARPFLTPALEGVRRLFIKNIQMLFKQ